MKQSAVISYRLAVMLLGACCLCGCDSLRFAVTEAQRENAWLHGQVCAMASAAALDENSSQALCDLTALAAEQSTAFVIDYGLPQTTPLPPSEDSPLTGGELDMLLLQGQAAATVAQADAANKPDVWTVADSAMELGIALAGLLGGAYGIRIAGYLKTAREKSKALKEIIAGNELFKQLYPEQAERFKEAQAKQSAQTKQLVTAAKTG